MCLICSIFMSRMITKVSDYFVSPISVSEDMFEFYLFNIKYQNSGPSDGVGQTGFEPACSRLGKLPLTYWPGAPSGPLSS